MKLAIMDKTPHQLAESLVGLSEEYSRYSGMYIDLVKLEAEFWKVHKDEYKSDTATQKAFDRTEDGLRMTAIKQKLKSITKTMSSYKTMIEVKTNEARGLY